MVGNSRTAGYSLKHEADSGILRCTLVGSLSDKDARPLAIALGHAIAEARRRSPVLRMLFDSRRGTRNLRSDAALREPIARIQSSREPGDRVAILVSSSLLKAQTRQQADPGDEIFISESAALTWLGA